MVALSDYLENKPNDAPLRGQTFAMPAAISNQTPGNLLDHVAAKLGVESDRQLARAIGTSAPRVSRIRNKLLPISGGILIRLNELTGMAIGDMREMAGLPRRMYISN